MKEYKRLSQQIKHNKNNMDKDQINDEFFKNLFKKQMKQLESSEPKSEIQEAHEIITKLLFAWETGMNKRYNDNHKITDKALDWLNRNSTI
jgi:coproporphyrinogen III oxidase-like Fe-S oxidoreductase